MAFPTINWADRAASATVDGGTSVTATEPTGAASGDLLVLFFASDGPQVTPTVDGFWTELRLGDATGAWGGVWFGIRGASAPDYQISWAGNEDASATAIHVDAGTFDAAAPIDLAEDVFNTALSGTVDAGPMAMTAGADRTTLSFAFGDGTSAFTPSDGGGFSTPPIVNWTERWDENFTAGGGRAAFTVDDVEYTGTDAAFRQNRASDEWGTIIFAIEPASAGQTIAVGTLPEVEVLIPVSAEKTIIVAIGTLPEVNALIPAGAAKAAPIGTLVETNPLIGIPAVKVAPIGTLLEANNLIPIPAVKPIDKPVGVLPETNGLNPIPPQKLAPIGTIGEFDSLIAILARKTANIGTIGESNILIPIAAELGAGQDIAVGTLPEVNAFITIQALKAALIGTLLESNVLNPIQALKLAAIGTIAENNVLNAIQAAKTADIGTIAEIDDLLPITVEIGGAQSIPVGVLAEFNGLVPLTSLKTANIGTIAEINTLIAILAGKAAGIGTLPEFNVLLPILSRKIAGIGTLAELDLLIAIAAQQPIVINLGTIAEFDLLIAIVPGIPGPTLHFRRTTITQQGLKTSVVSPGHLVTIERGS